MKDMLPYNLVDIVEVQVLEGYRLYLRFDNGTSGQVDIAELVSFEGVFAPLKDREYFARVLVNFETGTICWENGADLAPSYLYSHLTPTPKKENHLRREL
jgi:hypothetical protein